MNDLTPETELLQKPLKRLRYLMDHLLRVCHVLDLSSSIVENLIETSETISESRSKERYGYTHTFLLKARQVVRQGHMYHKSASTILTRANSISKHVRVQIPYLKDILRVNEMLTKTAT